MIIGAVKEIKPEEYRIAMLPEGVRQLVGQGHEVLIESGAGTGAGYSDHAYQEAGAAVIASAAEVYGRSELIVKVKEPIGEEFELFQDRQALFCYLHSETRPTLVDLLLRKRIVAIAFENMRFPDGSYPLLAPMSIIAGQQAVLQGMQFLCNHRGGVGQSLVTYPGLPAARIVVLGAGQAGYHAARTAAALGAEVSLFEINEARIHELAPNLPSNIRLLNIRGVALEPYVTEAALVINATTVPPESSYHLVDRALVSKMRKGAVIVDISANLKGAIETIDRYTSHKNPVWEVDGVIHYAVTNIPGTVARTASAALALAILPYLEHLAGRGVLPALKESSILANGLTAIEGELTWRDAGEFQSRPWTPPEVVLERLETS